MRKCVFFDIEALYAPVVATGLWMIFRAFKRGHFLEIETASGSKRLEFQGRPAVEALNTFVAEIERYYGFRVERDDPR